LNAAVRFAGFLRLGGLHVVEAPARMTVQDEKSGILALQCAQAIQQSDVFSDIRKVSGVIDVLVIHGASGAKAERKGACAGLIQRLPGIRGASPPC
jgi:hypothetical protein